MKHDHQRNHHHHRHHEDKIVQEEAPKVETKQAAEADNGWEPMSAEQISEMKAAEEDDTNYGVYDMMHGGLQILDTPEKMDPDYQAREHLKEVNALNPHSSA